MAILTQVRVGVERYRFRPATDLQIADTSAQVDPPRHNASPTTQASVTAPGSTVLEAVRMQDLHLLGNHQRANAYATTPRSPTSASTTR